MPRSRSSSSFNGAADSKSLPLNSPSGNSMSAMTTQQPTSKQSIYTTKEYDAATMLVDYRFFFFLKFVKIKSKNFPRPNLCRYSLFF
jgi:hypothetical protein